MRRTSMPESSSTLNPQKSVLLHPKSLRKLGKADLKQIMKLIDPKVTYAIFGKVDIEKMMALSFLTVGIEDENGRLAAAMILHTHPDVPALPPWEWEHFLYHFYGITDANSHNTLWIHLLVWDKKYETFFMRPMIHGLFRQYSSRKYFFLLAPPFCRAIDRDFLTDLATKYLPKGCQNQWMSAVLFAFRREHFGIQYKVRRAVEEDNDDLVPLIHQHSKLLEELYGKYYIAEILTSHKESGRHIIVAEYEGNAVAVVILNPAVNYKMLNEEFELATFNGLRKIHEFDTLDFPRKSNKCSMAENIVSQIELLNLNDGFAVSRSFSAHDGNVCKSPEDSDERLLHITDGSSSLYSLVLTTSSLFLFQEEDEDDDAAKRSPGLSRSSLMESNSYEMLHEYGFRPETDPRLTYANMMEKYEMAALAKGSDDSKDAALPAFYGEDNAFCLEVAAADPDHEYCLQLILECIYECFPDRDYCILHLPSDTEIEEWVVPFVRVVPRSTGTFPNELYVLHKNALLGSMNVEVLRRDYMHDIKELTRTIPLSNVILTQCEIFLETGKSPFLAFVLLCENKIVGVAILSEEFNIDHLDAHFEIEPWINQTYHRSGGYGLIESILVSPIFQNHSQYFISEIHRLGDFSAVFYRYGIEKTGKERPVVNLLNWFLPVMPRQQPELNNDLLTEEGYPLADMILHKESFVIYFSSTSLCTNTRYTLNTKNVVVSCINTALSFLIALTCSQYNPNYLATVISLSTDRYTSLNTKIVVVGCSNTALSFLIALTCSQYNPNYLVTVISLSTDRYTSYPLADMILHKESFVLYLSSTSLCTITRYPLNTKIVVVGCSNTALSFLIALTCSQYNPNYLVTFNNITLVCQYGIHPKLPKKIAELFLAQKNFLGGRYMDMLSLRTHVNVVQGILTKIDRKDKYLVINESSILNYDLLFIMHGEKFQKPLRNNRMPFAENPDNMFLIHCGTDAHNAVTKLRQMHHKSSLGTQTIVVYGHYLQAYTCVAALLSFGVPGSNIILVEPFPYAMNIDRKPRQNISIFNDSEIYHAVKAQITLQGITVHSSYYFIDWQYDKDQNVIRSVKFESKHKMIEIDCWAVFFYYDKNISPRIYQVINNAGLVFDGRLVIDNTCRTNDPCIYGAGTLTKYSRKYYASHMIHKYYNKVEIGNKLGQQIKNKLIPGWIRKYEPKKHGWNFQLDMRDRLVPIYHQPVMRYCKLPGNLYYLCIDKPGKSMPWESTSAIENSGQVFITGNCHNLTHQGFFKLQLDEFNRVETIICLTKSPIDVKNLYCIWGKHERFLNNLQTRFEMLMITDFFKFFQAPWAYAIYHDRFEDLVGELNYLITSSVGTEGESLIEDLIKMYEDRKWRKLTPDEDKEVETKFSQMLYTKIIEEKVLDFIKENLNYLPMYAHPVVIRKMVEGFDKSPLFRKW